jgi:predicted nucleotidyltransferase
MHRQRRADLYLLEYPRLIRQINRLIEMVRSEKPEVALLALFGSTARLSPHTLSDADLLILLSAAPAPSYAEKIASVMHLVSLAQDAPRGEWCAWSFSVVDGDAQASDLDPDFLENVARDGVLLYQQEGATLPAVLSHLQPYERWLRRVEALLARASRTGAASRL